jgi:hypothetical protein
MKHKHAEVIKAFVDGIECEYWSKTFNTWEKILCIQTFDFAEKVRIKPEPKPDIVDYLFVGDYKLFHYPEINWVFKNTANLKLTWDGETNKLKSAEVIK